MTEPRIHSGLTDSLPEEHRLAWEPVYCSGSCTPVALLHAGNNENMQTWIEAPLGNYCLPCFTAIDQVSDYEGWSR